MSTLEREERFGGRVEKGQVVFDDPRRWRGVVGRHEGKRVKVTIERERKLRSLKANAYLWGVVYRTIAEWSGHDDEEIHDAMKSMFLPKRELLLPTGEEIPAHGSTRVLDDVEFSDYVSKVKRWAGEQGVLVPEPDDFEVGI